MSATSKSAAHTPGPWRIDADDNLIVAADGDYICSMSNMKHPGVAADAALIAAAPDLLAALVAIELGCSFPADDVQRAIRDRARAATARAEGRE